MLIQRQEIQYFKLLNYYLSFNEIEIFKGTFTF